METRTQTLTGFLLARIADDERFARDALARASIYDAGHLRWNWLRTDGESSTWEPTNHSPERVIAECEAKRALLIDHAVYDGDGLGRCGACADAYVAVPWDGLCDVAQILASVYSDHPDYMPEWRLGR